MRRIHSLAGAFCAAALLSAGMPLNIEAAGAKIAWVSFHSGDSSPSAAAAGVGFTQAPDVEYTRLLQSAGHQVTRYVTTATPDVNLLNTFDLVILSRSVPSGNYQSAASTALWHGLTKPTMILGGYVLRASRLGYTTGETIPDTAGTIRLNVSDSAHPIFTNISLDANKTMVNPYADLVSFNGSPQRGISVNTSPVVDGGKVLATVGTDTDPAFTGMIVGEFPAGTVMGNGSADTTAAKRLVFLTGSRELGITSEAAGIYDLQTDGARLFLNAVNYMAGLPITEPPPLITNLRPASGTKQHYAPVGLSFSATTGGAAGIPTTNISLVLNGSNVSSGLVITGTAQDRRVVYTNLASNIDYAGVITVRDAFGKETVLNFSFDTKPAFQLPAEFAFPISAAASAAPGMRALVRQAPDSATLVNSADRAEAQLAGTLIDTATGAPYENVATPSTDNPDGAYNQSLINWNVEAGVAEAGNFRAPQFADQTIPGATHALNVAAEVTAYLELAPGRYVMGVNSDDGFVVYAGVHPRDAFAVDLGRFEGGRAAADTTFQFDVTQAGLYPFRVLYYQGAGAGSLEWFTVDPFTSEKTLVNDRNNPKAVRAWRQLTVPERPFITSVQPARNAVDVPVDAAVTLKLQDTTAQVQQNSVQLTLNGQTVAAQVTKTGAVTTVTYTPAPKLAGDTTYTVGLAYADSSSFQRNATYQFATKFVPPVLTNGANIVWVSFHAADDQPSTGASGAGFTEAPDIDYTRLLQTSGHRVTRYVTSATPDIDLLNTFDLVIISRSVPSGNYQSAASTALWHGITKPTIVMGGYVLRGSRLGYTSGETIPDTGGTIKLKVRAPNHPIFAGVDLDANTNTVSTFAKLVTYNGTVQRGISVNTSPITPGGTILAVVERAGDAANGGMVIGEFPAGTVMSNGSRDTTAGKRLVFLTGSREQGISAEAAGIYDLEGDGPRMFLNAIKYMAGITDPTPANVSLSAALSANRELVISWPEAGSSGFVLQSTASLTAPNWQNVAGAPVLANGRFSVTVPTTDAARFYRLRKP